MRSLTRILALAAMATFFGTFMQLAPAALPGGISGSWYNPDQSGHGITLLLVQPDFAQAVWSVYDTDGNPLTLVVEGDVSGHGIEGTAYAPRGMRFGEFDPADNEVSIWGKVTIDFSSCDRAELSWDANDPGYGQGSMPLHRLAGTAGSDCMLPPVETTRFGRYTGEVVQRYEPYPETTVEFTGIVDLEGRLWGIERLRYPIPSPMWVGGRAHHVVRTEPARDDGSLRGRADRVYWTGQGPPTGSFASGSWPEGEPGGELLWSLNNAYYELSWSPAGDDRALIAPVDTGALAGRWVVPLQSQFEFQKHSAWLNIETNGHACIEMSLWYEPPGGCHFEGQIYAPDGEYGLIDFEFHRPEESPGTPHRGRGWLTDGPEGLELILVGSDGFGLMAYPEP